MFGVPTKYLDNSSARSRCGYQSCAPSDPNALNVHLVPHSHDDVGWLKTVDQYYWGAETYIQRAGVQYILDSVVTALHENPDRRFIQVETAFFHKWWKEQSENRKELVRELVNSGRLEIINGAWSMNDEAAVHYQSIIDQFTLGLRTINDTLGECGRPKIGWQIDPFGHSREMASIFSQMGYDGLFFSRLDWREKNTRLFSNTPEMLWQGSPNLGDNSNLFTSILYNHYSAPSGYCFDILCTDAPIIDDVDSPEYNYQEKIEGFASFIRRQAQYYVTNNIIITMGDDFN
ncbi:Glycosyl hydrolases family 38 N-terminal domain [Popillia japonica]|uniref:Glycosyl hydrolases family 38 N-terminal domain n=1 Tax=Popillia japonica TaxID=7064 RepID=A0AAW1IUB6_POPJA